MILRLNYSMFIPIVILLYASVWSSLAVELTFELPDRDQQCFYEEIKQGTRGTLEYQVTYYITTYGTKREGMRTITSFPYVNA